MDMKVIKTIVAQKLKSMKKIINTYLYNFYSFKSRSEKNVHVERL